MLDAALAEAVSDAGSTRARTSRGSTSASRSTANRSPMMLSPRRSRERSRTRRTIPPSSRRSTAAAFLAFRAAKVEVAVLEVGLGGRLDATNIVEVPLAASIVTISRGANGKHLEHGELLGTTVTALAREKAGIFKRGAPAILGPLDEEARRAALGVAEAVGAKPIVDAVAFVEETGLKLVPALLGAHQVDNAAVAAAMLEVARHHLPRLTRDIEAGIAHARWPGASSGSIPRIALPSCSTQLTTSTAHARSCVRWFR